MIQRLISPLKTNSFFLFGPRGTGKSTLLRSLFLPDEMITIDLLDPVQENLFITRPQELEHRVEGVRAQTKWIVIDEIQKAPQLLNLVHRIIEKKKILFALTGSSPRKLKRGASNLLAGRAFVNHLFPLTHLELKKKFHLLDTLNWGTLPKLLELPEAEEKAQFLTTYALTYLKEEIAAEQAVRKLDPFRNFLEVAAQSNGDILNYSNISRDVGVDVKTVQSYFSLLEETLIGILLPPYHKSIRKQQRTNPKFYFFDPGLKKALDRTIRQPLQPKTYAFGKAFEHFLIVEIIRLNEYFKKEWRFSYLRTKDDAEIDLIIDRPGFPSALIEIKSRDHVSETDLTTLNRFQADIKNSQAYCLSLDPHRKKIGKILCLYWQEGLGELGLTNK